MTIQEFKDKIQEVCLAHMDVKTFKLGNAYNRAEDNSTYPLCYLEMPYDYTYNKIIDNNADEINIQLDVLLLTNTDDVKDDHAAISIAKEIADNIVNYINYEVDEVVLTLASGLSLREFSDDDVAGWRLDLTFQFNSEVCDYKQYFDFN